jgi:P4 family phage/plasmid primase-like protien
MEGRAMATTHSSGPLEAPRIRVVPDFAKIARAMRTFFPDAATVPLGRNKKPTTAWKEFQQGMSDDQLAKLIREFPHANCAMLTGPTTAFVVDADGPEGVDYMLRLCDGDLPLTPRVASRGRDNLEYLHFYFQYPDFGVKNAARLLPSLDWRAFGGYVVAPGSVRSDGVVSEWLISPDDAPLARMPKSLEDFLRHRYQHDMTPPAEAKPFTGGDLSAYAKRALEAESERVRSAPFGTQSMTLISAAFSIGQLVAGGAIPASVASAELYAAGTAMANQPGREAWKEKELRDHADRGITNGTAYPREVPKRAHAHQVRYSGNGRRGEDAERESAGELLTPTKYNDIRLAKMFAEEYGDDLRYVDKLARWFHFLEAEGRWAEDEKLNIYTLCKKFLTVIAVEAKDATYKAVMSGGGDEAKAQKAASVVANALTSAKKVHAVIDLARSELVIPLDVFDSDHWLLNTPGGAVDLKTGALRPAARNDYFTKVTKVAPQQMPTPLHDKFSREVMGVLVPIAGCECAACVESNGCEPDEERQRLHDEEVDKLVAYMDQLDAYCLTGDVKRHMLILEIGEGGNGKGLRNDLLSQDILGLGPVGYACEVPVEALLASRNDRHPTDLMCLYRSRLAIARESEDRNWNEGMVKRLSGGDVVTARKMRTDFITFAATHKLVVFGQHKPALRGSDEQAWKRRLHLIPFPQKWDLPANKNHGVLPADLGLRTKLAAEAPGILHKLIMAGVELYKRGGEIKKPETVRLAGVNYLADEDDLGAWVRDNFQLDPRGFVDTDGAFEQWRMWCKEHRLRPGRPSEFPNEMVKRFNDPSVRRERLDQRGIRGISWREKRPQTAASTPRSREPGEEG